MKLLDVVRRQKSAGEALPAGHQWTMGSQAASVALTVALWVLIALGPLSLVVALVAANRPAAVSNSAGVTSKAQTDQLVAGEFATRAIKEWLSAYRGQEQSVRALLPVSSTQILPSRGSSVTDTAVAGYADAGGGVWSVTVAATVADSRHTARRFFTLPVKVEGSTAVALSMPAEVPSTIAAANPPLVDYPVSIQSDSPVATTAAEFLGSYLAGAGDVARVVTPNAPIVAVRPASFVGVKVDQIAAHSEVPNQPGDGVQVDVLVTAVASVSAQQSVTVQYPLVLTARGGRWEVSQVRLAPLVAAKQPPVVPPTAAQAPSFPPNTSSAGSSTQR